MNFKEIISNIKSRNLEFFQEWEFLYDGEDFKSYRLGDIFIEISFSSDPHSIYILEDLFKYIPSN